MFEQTSVRDRPSIQAQDTSRTDLVEQGGQDPEEVTEAGELLTRRHSTLIEIMLDELDLQQDERVQMQIDDDYYHHLQWRPEDAQALIERGQAPMVYNEARASIDWISGTEKRTRKDYKVLPREKNDEQGAEIKTKLMKWSDDVNLTAYHRSAAFKVTCISGLSWLEESINTDPEAEMIQGTMEDWRNVVRDSRSRGIDYNDDARYLYRKKPIDLDYAVALLPDSREDLINEAGWSTERQENEDAWYLGEKLFGAGSEDDYTLTRRRLGDHTAFVTGGTINDTGRRHIVELIEAWYRVPQTVQVFQGGNFDRQVYDEANPEHMLEKANGARLYSTVKMVMRVMICTRNKPLWDGPSPFKHQKFTLVPVIAYRRGRDGMIYGMMRGMRDPQDGLNKNMAKSQFIMANNRITVEDGAVDDIEDLREEAARPDGIILVNKGYMDKVRFEKLVGEFKMLTDSAQMNMQSLRNVGGVTNDNLGRNTRQQSGVAIERKQDQGSLTTTEIFDNFLRAIKLAGQLRLSHMEQFMSMPKVLRVVGESTPIEWVPINQQQPDGQWLNDITASQADFIVDTQDFHSTLAETAMLELFDLLQKMATFSPQTVLALLDLVVDSTPIPGKAEWVARIRKINGQRDPTKQPTPEEIQAEQQNAAKQQKIEQINIDTLQAKLDELKGKAGKMGTDEVLVRAQSLLAAIETAQIAATVPNVVASADIIATSIGFQDQSPADGVFAPVGGMPAVPMPLAQPPGLPAPGNVAPGATLSAPEAQMPAGAIVNDGGVADQTAAA